MAVTPITIAGLPTLTIGPPGAGALATANSIDAANDYLSIYTASATATQGINRNTLLGLSSAPVGINDTQTIKNKILDNTNLVTLLDGSFTLQNNVDSTKRALFSAAAITTGTTRTYTLPNVTDTLVSLTATQTLTNKTLTSPTISAPTITNATLSADTITGFTTSSNGSIYGISVTSSKISGTVITNTTLPYTVLDNGVSWVLQSWTPTWVNWNIGNGTVIAKYIQIGKLVYARLSVTWGSTTSITGGDPTFTLPATAVSGFYIPFQPAPGTGGASIDSTGSGSALLIVDIRSTTTASLHTLNVAGTYPNVTSISNSAPISHTTGSVDTCEFWYEAA